MTGPTAHSQPSTGLAGERKAEKVVARGAERHGFRRLQRGLPDQRQDRAHDDVPVLVDVDRNHRLKVEVFLRAVIAGRS